MAKSNRVLKTFNADGTWTAPGGVTAAKVSLFLDQSMENQNNSNSLSQVVLGQDGQVYAWGLNSSGQLGLGDVVPRSSPVLVLGGFKYYHVAVGGNGSGYGLSTTNDGYAWGVNNTGQLGLGDVTARSSPVLIVGGLKFVSLGAGSQVAYGITTDLDAYGWGVNLNGELGDGTVVAKSSPVLVLGGHKFKRIFSGNIEGAQGASVYGLLEDGTAYAWGKNTSGQLGLGDVVARSSPILVLGGLKFQTLAVGASYVLGITTTGVLYAWGANVNGQLGTNDVTPRSSPVLVVGGRTYMAAAAGGSSGGAGAASLAVTTDRDAYSWGGNNFGQLGHNDVVTTSSPTIVVGGRKFLQSFASNDSFHLLDQDGLLYGMGENTNGNIGDGTVTNRSSPTLVIGTTRFESAKKTLVNSQLISVTPGTTYTITIQALFAQFGVNSLGDTGQRHVELEYFT